MSNWIANATGIHISPKKTYVDRKQFGGALKTLAPAAALIPGVGVGLAAGIGALGSAAGKAIQPGSNFGDILKSGAIGGATAYGGAKGMQALRGAFSPSSVANTVMTNDGTGHWLQTAGPGMESNMSHLAHAFGSGAKTLGSQAAKNPLVVGQVASSVLGAKAQSDATDMQQEQFDFQKQQYADQAARRKRLQEMLAPLLASYAPGGGY